MVVYGLTLVVVVVVYFNRRIIYYNSLEMVEVVQ